MECPGAKPGPGGGGMPPRWDLDRQYGGPKRRPGTSPRPRARSRLRLVWRAVGWLLAGLALGAAVAWGAEGLRSRAAPIELVSWGTVEETFPVRALVIRREEVEVAPISGRLSRLAGEEERVALGQAVVELVNPEASASLAPWAADVKEAWEHFQKEDGTARPTPPRQAAAKQAAREKERAVLLSRQARLATLSREAVVRLSASQSGLVSYHVDGLEPQLRPDRLPDIDPRLAESPPPLLPAPGDQAQAGQPLFKVVDPEYAVLAFRLPEPQAQMLDGRGRVRLVRPDRPGEELVGRVELMGPRQSDGYRPVYVRLQSLLGGDLATARAVSLSVTLRIAQGPRVPSAAITPDPGSAVPSEASPGVWLEEAGEAHWRSVTVEANDGHWAVVRGLTAGTVLATKGEGRKIR